MLVILGEERTAMTKGYVIFDVPQADVPTTDAFQEYRRRVTGIIATYGGRFLVRAGEARLLEGDGEPGRMVVIEFDSPERAVEWYNSPEYQAILPLRGLSRATCVAGVSEA
jgi:uncharacterized protein (DUF1330 family)